MALIEIKNVGYVYKQVDEADLVALRGVSLNIEKGEFVTILGANGSGKSTLAKLMNGLLLPTDGEVFVDGIPTTDQSRIFEVRSKVGMVFQNPDNQMVASNIEDDLAFGPENLGVPREEIAVRIDEALAAVGMTEHKKGTPFKLSGGQKQRIAIAAVLAMKPEVLVLDESTAMLDPKGRREIMKVLFDLKSKGITIVLITHYMDEAYLSDRVVVINDGRIVKDCLPKELFLQDDPEKYGLCLPPFFDIVNKLRACGIEIGAGVDDVQSLAEVLCRL